MADEQQVQHLEPVRLGSSGMLARRRLADALSILNVTQGAWSSRRGSPAGSPSGRTEQGR
jgi:hypothetical protein